MKIGEDFVKAYYSEMKTFFLEFPKEQYQLTEENYWDKVMSPNEINEIDFDAIESKLKFKLPESFKSFYKSFSSLEEQFDFGGGNIVGNHFEKKLNPLFDFIFENGVSEEILKLNLIPFGIYQDEWFICLDMNSKTENPKIKLFELSIWHQGKKAVSPKPWFSSFESMLSCFADLQTKGNEEGFDKIDPTNHFLTAYPYWN